MRSVRSISRPLSRGARRLGALLACCAGQAHAQTDINWLNAVSGNWSGGANWSMNQVPNSVAFNAIINAFGNPAPTPYTVFLDNDFTVNDVSVLSNEATLMLNAGRTLSVQGAYTQTSSMLTGDAGSLLEVFGAASFNDAAVVLFDTVRTQSSLMFGGDNVTLMWGSFESLGTLSFNSIVASDICDVDIGHNGTQMDWGPMAGALRLGMGSVITNGAASTFTINNAQTMGLIAAGQTGSFVNEGVMVKASAGTTQIDGVALTNHATTGTVEVGAGTLMANTVTNYSAGAQTLTGGKWRVMDAATLDFAGQSIATNKADITLSGAGSAFADLTGFLSLNDTDGRLKIENGRNLTTAGDFANKGVVDVGAGTTFAVAAGSTFSSFNAGTKTLTEGTYDLKGRFRFDGADVANIAAKVTLDGAGAGMVNELDVNALLQSATTTNTIAPTGELTIKNGVMFTTGGDLNVEQGGKLTVDTGTMFRVDPGSSLLNITPTGVFNNAGITVRGTLQADNADVNEIGAGSDILLDGSTSQIINGMGQSAFAALALVNDGGFGISGGRALTITNPMNPFRQTGANARVLVGPRGTLDSADAGGKADGVQSVLTTTGDVLVENGVTTIDDGILRIEGAGGLTQTGGVINLLNGGEIQFTHPMGAFAMNGGTVGGQGTIHADAAITGAITPGASIGTLHFGADATLSATAILTLDFASAASWDRLTIAGDLAFAGGAAGTLRIAFGAGFDAPMGTLFEVVAAGARSGTFATHENLAFGPGKALAPVYAGGSLFLQVVPAPGAPALLALGLVVASRRRR